MFASGLVNNTYRNSLLVLSRIPTNEVSTIVPAHDGLRGANATERTLLRCLATT